MYVCIMEGENHHYQQNTKRGRENGGGRERAGKKSRRAKAGFINPKILKVTKGLEKCFEKSKSVNLSKNFCRLKLNVNQKEVEKLVFKVFGAWKKCKC